MPDIPKLPMLTIVEKLHYTNLDIQLIIVRNCRWDFIFCSCENLRESRSSFSYIIQSCQKCLFWHQMILQQRKNYLRWGSTWWSLDQESKAYPTELVWHVLDRRSLNFCSYTNSLFGLNWFTYRVNRPWQKGPKSLRFTSTLWSSGRAQLEVNFADVKSFDVNIAIIGNLVLIAKNSIQMKQ